METEDNGIIKNSSKELADKSKGFFQNFQNLNSEGAINLTRSIFENKSEERTYFIPSFPGFKGSLLNWMAFESEQKVIQPTAETTQTFKRIDNNKITDFDEILLGKRNEIETPNINMIFEKFDGDFESDSENALLSEPFDKNQKAEISFLINEKIGFRPNGTKLILDFKHFIKKANTRFESNKIYTCEKCNETFNKHAALGGHMSKVHPKESKKFEERMNVYALRKSEREKRKFLNNL